MSTELDLQLIENGIVTKDGDRTYITYDHLMFGFFKCRRKEYLKIIRAKDGVMFIDAEQFWRLRNGNECGFSICRGGKDYDQFYLGGLDGWEVAPD